MSRKIEILVGFFVSLGILALVLLALKVANAGISGGGETYNLYAKFDNIGSLKVRSPIKVGGVVVGRVEAINLDPKDYTPVVHMKISSEFNQLSETTSVNILTSGILGEQYLGLNPGVLANSSSEFSDEISNLFEQEKLKILQDGDMITDTKSALVLEELIGQFLFNQGGE
ncbi:outer membrane lipid asymmetry maintenance protein MlaD [Pseudoalteromonas tunicata]|jgi:phospholipid/cholesterol/gamma-HCH transport system substrate-binding protein|uniref:Mce family protein n=1 Tax=Pseudoalteromonas tunicata D2 TaxID=87626 RepID=A4CF23_9GAMM|nr:outer membrane lipid asymmetry maintenance protein MlaD [Pseudoalteromonas tunicata]ATC96162.1 phospholipid/cholesterol/gamma-HCH transport system substrate-binding protein [Pseudoalteromonas tunicata]AXT31680.1 outer membrane lipid asymmetry maintenance protein MlaD [Pseudoalteromonas tunicata]EAR26698.1 mce family protein [Pseudoalteromonas tunicata D2]MDP4983236.1 outer membrane lipid asymmetry maintenance protein MlaD [Pseudoalteromonas tunicata]MDP5215180.1 outer membrane lipid asymmet